MKGVFAVMWVLVIGMTVYGLIDIDRISTESYEAHEDKPVLSFYEEPIKYMGEQQKAESGQNMRSHVDFDLEHLSIVRQEDEYGSNDKQDTISSIGEDTGIAGEDQSESGSNSERIDEECQGRGGASDGTEGTGEGTSGLGGISEEDNETNGTSEDNGNKDSGLTYLGDWTITAYCPCSECCGEWATGYTASGNLAVSGHTVACNSLPFYSRVIIDGVEYVVEDTGSTDYGDAWIDIFFDTHEEALAYGVQVREVYLVE